MAFGLYKPGQGYWTRLMSAIGAGMLAVSGAMWIWQQLSAVQTRFEIIYLQATVAAIITVLSGLLIYWIIGRKPRTVEFLIATEGEMRKVNWSTKKEIMGSTWVVIGISLIIATILLCADLIFARFFQAIGVLEKF